MDASSQYVWNVKFINEIEKRPGIWNETIKSRDLQKRLWEELSILYSNKSVDSLKRKYTNLKLKFQEQLNLIPQTNNEYDIDPRSFESDWPHYQQMLFLLNEVETKRNKKRKATSEEQVTVSQKRVRTPADPEIQHDMWSDEMLKEGASTEVIVKPDIPSMYPTEDGLYHFLMGLYGGMNELDPIRRITVQARIYAMLSQELTAASKK